MMTPLTNAKGAEAASNPAIGQTSPASVPTRSSSRRTRKMQPGIKDSLDKFLENWTDSQATSPKSSKPSLSSPFNPRKRKPSDFEDDRWTDSTSPSIMGMRNRTTAGRMKEKGVSDKTTKKDEKKRLKLFRKKPPQTFLEKLNRAQTQRMFVIGRVRSDTKGLPQEDMDIVGSTGNIYRVTIGQLPSCTCPDHQKGNECKHKVYAMHTVLKAPEYLQYQMAFLSSELDEIFANAPPIPTESFGSNDTDGKRKSVKGECPICYMDFDEQHNELVWCKAACGNNMHKSCFDQWVASQRGTTVKCVYCRTPWHIDHGGLETITKDASVNEEGYVNVAEQFGISRDRDYSSYHQPWVRRQFGRGW